MTRTPPTPSIHRRQFLAGLGALALLPIACDVGDVGADAIQERWLSATGDDESSYGLVIATAAGEATIIHTGFRGHAIVPRPGHARALMFGRRPNQLAVDVDIEAGQVVQELECAEGRAMQGHGCYSADGQLLITVEADLVTAEGKLVVRDADTFEILRELASHGIGPHPIALMPDGKTLVVANGGLLTRPETGAEVLNLDTMRSSLAYVDLETGALLDEQLVPEPKASIRHLDVCPDGTVVIGTQIQREAAGHDELVPLVAVQLPGEPLRMLESGLELVAAMQDYAGSVTASPLTRVAAVTSPRGDLALFWHLDSGELLGHLEFHDVCGAALSTDQTAFVLSGGGGQVRRVDAATLELLPDPPGPFADVRWDNHMIALLA